MTKSLGRGGSLGVLRSSETQLWGHLSLMLLVTLNITLGQARSVLYWGSHNTSQNTPCLPLSLHLTRDLSVNSLGGCFYHHAPL